jgi:hypothetical protein
MPSPWITVLPASTLALLLATSACFNPSYDAPACGPGGECPDGLTCVADVCQASAGADASLTADTAPPDDAPPAGCYDEAAEDANDSGAEGTGLTIDENTVRICGELADRVPIGGVVDTDRYTVSTARPFLIATISAPGASAYQQVALQLGMQQAALLVDDEAEVSAVGSGTVTLVVQASNPAAIGQAVAYEISIRAGTSDDLCGTEDPAGYVEMLDTAANMYTGNDVLSSLLQQPFVLTASPDDLPEETTFAVDDVARFKVGGIATNTVAQADMYKDRDTYAFTTGPTTTHLTVNLSWPEDTTTNDDNVDLDYFVAVESTLQPVQAAVAIGFTGLEYGSSAVLPDTRYLLIVGDWNDAVSDKPYTVTLCGAAK